MAQSSIANLIPRGSLGLKLLLVCLLTLAMGLPLLFVGLLVAERQSLANQVTIEVGAHAGGPQIVGGPMLVVPTAREIETTDDQGRTQRRTQNSYQIIFATTGEAETRLEIEQRRRGIYRAALYRAATDFEAAFDPAAAIAETASGTRYNWAEARIVMYVSDPRAIREAVQVRFEDGSTLALEPFADPAIAAAAPPNPIYGGSITPSTLRPIPQPPTGMQLLAARATPVLQGPRPFELTTRLEIGGAHRFALAAFAQETRAVISGDWRATRAEGYFQTDEPMDLTGAEADARGARAEGFVASWRVPYIARGLDKAADVAILNIGQTASRDMAVSFTQISDIYQGVMRAVRYGLMFVGIVFLAVLIFEAVSGRKAHPAQYILVGLAQCVFYLLLLSLTELIGFTPAFLIAAGATVALLSYYAAAAFNSRAVGLRAFAGLAVLYAAMYFLMTLEDYALLAGSIVSFLVIVAAMFATRRIDWYGQGGAKAADRPAGGASS